MRHYCRTELGVCPAGGLSSETLAACEILVVCLSPGLAVAEMAVSELPSNPLAVWTVRASRKEAVGVV